jgi:PAS domain S-box-containing protein
MSQRVGKNQTVTSILRGPGSEIGTLVGRLHETVQRLHELTRGEVDSVVSPSGDSYLLQQAQEQLRQSETLQRESAEMQSSIMDVLPAHIALLDHEGNILSVNNGWRQFSWNNALESSGLGVGQNYLTACDTAREPFAEGPIEAAAGIRAVLAGLAPQFSFEYACHSPTERRWFRLMVRPLEKVNLRGAVVMHVDITARKLAEEAVGESEARFQGTFEQAAVGIAHVSADGFFLRVNDKLCAILGYLREELLGLPVVQLVFPEDQPASMEASRAMLAAERSSYTRETRYRRKDGNLVWANFVSTLERSSDGKAKYFICVFEDISRRKQAEERVRRNEALLRMAGRTARMGGWAVDLSEKRVVWSDEVCAIHEVPAETSPALEEAIDYYAPQCREEIRKTFEACARDGGPFDLETELITAKGTPVWVRAIGEAVRDANGAITRVQGAFQDITERRRAEQILRESEERFRQIAENINEVFWITDSERRRVIYVSPAFEKIWGRSPDELYGDTEGWIGTIHPEDRRRVEEAIRCKPTSEPYEEVYRICRSDGAVRWIRDRAFPLKDGIGEVYRTVGVAEDITEMKKLETQFLRAQRMECIGTLAGGIAHDLNNILSPILISANLLRNAGSLRDVENIIPLIESSAKRGSEVVRQLLIFGRGIESQRVLIEVRHLMKEMVEIMRETFPKNIKIEFRIPNELWPVLGDATQLHQVLLNLCVNARDAMPEGGTVVLNAQNIELDAAACKANPEARAGSFVKLEVMDNGSGISAEVMTKVFEPFFTTKPIGKGTGLGLSTVLGIVKNHGGFINVQSEVGKGTQFDVYLAAKPTAPEPPATSANSLPAKRGHGELLLLVDDEPDILSLSGAMLEHHGYQVITARDGVDALELFAKKKQAIRVVVTDLMMPRMDGLSLARGLQEIDSEVKVIVTSGSIDDARAEGKIAQLEALGVAGILAKPYPAEKLLTALQQVLREPAP